jgi:hypothetical protein
MEVTREKSLRRVLTEEFEIKNKETPSYGSKRVQELMLEGGRPERMATMLEKGLNADNFTFHRDFRCLVLFNVLSPIEAFAPHFFEVLELISDPKTFCNIVNDRFLFNFQHSDLYLEMKRLTNKSGRELRPSYSKLLLENDFVKQLLRIGAEGFNDFTTFATM